MIPEHLVKRCFPALICGLIATAAHYQASGMSSLLEDALLTETLPEPVRPPPRARPPVDLDHTTSAAAILDRNPFDSVTGSLTRKMEEDVERPGPALGDPLEDPICESARVLLIVASEDPAWSFATIAAGSGEPLLRRLGDPVEQRAVHAIGWDRVWLTEAGSRCQLRIGDNAGLRPAPAPPSPPARPASKRPARGSLPPEIASKIQKVSDREFIVDRTAVDLALEKQGELMRSARVVPVKEGDRVVGVRLARVTPNSLLPAIGLKTGDTIRSINGFELTDPQSALQAYARLSTANNLAIAVKRGGKDMTIDVRIK